MTIAVSFAVRVPDDMIEDPDYAVRLMTFITRAAETRIRRWPSERAGVFQGPRRMADDSIQMISTEFPRDGPADPSVLVRAFGPWPNGMHLRRRDAALSDPRDD